MLWCHFEHRFDPGESTERNVDLSRFPLQTKAIKYGDGTVVVNLDSVSLTIEKFMKVIDLKNAPIEKLKNLIVIKGEDLQVFLY